MIDIAGLYEKLKASFSDQIELSENNKSLYAKRESIVGILKALKEELGYDRLLDVTSADYEDRFEVVYNVINDEMNILTIKVKLDKNDNKIPSVESVWRYANPMEREIYDLMGIVFEGHENLNRIFNPEDFEGHPLRKSYKLDIVNRF